MLIVVYGEHLTVNLGALANTFLDTPGYVQEVLPE